MSTRTVVITGGLGNLGTKLCRHLLGQSNDNSSPPPFKVILVEVKNILCTSTFFPCFFFLVHMLFFMPEGGREPLH